MDESEVEVELKKSIEKSNIMEPKSAANGPVLITPLDTVIMKQINVNSDSSEMEINDGYKSPQTPKNCVFDPFAPGPENMACAPVCKKYVEEIRNHVNRCLSFGPSVKPLNYDVDGLDYNEEEMIDYVYDDLLEAILTKQAEAYLAKHSSDAFETPPSAPRMTAIAETCPGAPIKSSGSSRKVEMLGICKKLEF